MTGLHVPLETIKRNNRESAILGDVSRTRRYLGSIIEGSTDDEYNDLLRFCLKRVAAPTTERGFRRRLLLELMAVSLCNIDHIDQDAGG